MGPILHLNASPSLIPLGGCSSWWVISAEWELKGVLNWKLCIFGKYPHFFPHLILMWCFFFELIVRLVSGTIPGDFLYRLRYLSSSLAAFAVYMCHCLYTCTLHRLPWCFVVGAYLFWKCKLMNKKTTCIYIYIYVIQDFFCIPAHSNPTGTCRWGILDTLCTCMKLNS